LKGVLCPSPSISRGLPAKTTNNVPYKTSFHNPVKISSEIMRHGVGIINSI